MYKAVRLRRRLDRGDMRGELDNETWILERGDSVIKRMASDGVAVLKPLEKLIYCLWVADYGMRNAGDLDTASDLYERFQDEAISLAQELRLHMTQAAFCLPRSDLEQQYFQLFDGCCNEIRAAKNRECTPNSSPR
jgi:hypothetical protein